MTLKTRIKRAFTRGSSADSEGGSLGKLSSRSSKKSQPKPDPNVYQPGEKMPPLKYRRPVDPAHKAHLESFTWAKAWRRRSIGSVYSPMGSRMPSRKASRTTLGRKSIGGRSRKSFGAASQRSLRSLRDRKISSRDLDEEACFDSGFGGSVLGDGLDQHPDIREGSDEEGDITNVGLSRNPTEDPRDPRNRRKSSSADHRSQSTMSGTSRPATADPARSGAVSNTQPFTQEELEAALRKSRLEDMKEESDQSKNVSEHETPGDLTRTLSQLPTAP